MLNELIHFRNRVRTVFSFNRGTSAKPAGRRHYLNNLVLHFSPVLAVNVIPLLARLVLVLIPFLKAQKDLAGLLRFDAQHDRRAELSAVAVGDCDYVAVGSY